MNGYLTTRELAKRWPMYKRQSLANLRCRGEGPKFEKVYEAVVYKLEAVEKYEKRHPEVLHISSRSRKSK